MDDKTMKKSFGKARDSMGYGKTKPNALQAQMQMTPAKKNKKRPGKKA